MSLIIDYQVASTATDLPTTAQLETWVAAALAEVHIDTPTELTIRVVDADEGQSLNQQYRGRDYATNVLSFPFDAEIELPVKLLGDLVICSAVVATEAKEQHKALHAHWAHMVVHGTLHLLGYDHIEEQEADAMEALERQIMLHLGYADPYQEIS